MELKQCCCFDLRTGTQIIGWLGLTFSTISTIFLSHFISTSQRFEDSLYFGILDGISVITVFTSLVLIIGAIKNKKYFLLPHLVWNGIGIVLGILATFYILFVNGNIEAIEKAFLEIGVTIYYWLCVRAYYISLDNNETETDTRYPLSSTTESNQNTIAPTNIVSNQPPAYTDIEKNLETKHKL